MQVAPVRAGSFEPNNTFKKFLRTILKIALKWEPDGWHRRAPFCSPRRLPAKLTMHTSASLSLVSELERLVAALGSDDLELSQISLSAVGERIAKGFGVRISEVAVMGLSARWRHLYFIVPEALKNVGYIPLSSNSELAARTARESRPEINNNFGATRHASVFEGVKIGNESPEAIQKIISAPILFESKVVGIIQISRKGESAKTVGPDFTAEELGKVLALCKPLGKILHRLTTE